MQHLTSTDLSWLKLGDLATWLTALATVGALLFAAKAAQTAKKLYDVESTRDVQAAEDRIDRETERKTERQLDLALQVAESYETYLVTTGDQQKQALAKLRALLTAIPIKDLQLLRHQFGVYPDARSAQYYVSFRDKPAALINKTRDQVAALLYALTGHGTTQDYEPLKFPAGDRSKGSDT